MGVRVGSNLELKSMNWMMLSAMLNAATASAISHEYRGSSLGEKLTVDWKAKEDDESAPYGLRKIWNSDMSSDMMSWVDQQWLRGFHFHEFGPGLHRFVPEC